MEVAHPLRIHTHIGRGVLVFSSVFLCLLQYEVLSGISGEWFYLDHLLCDLPGLVNVQGNLGIPHHRIKCSALAQAGGGVGGGTYKAKISLICRQNISQTWQLSTVSANKKQFSVKV